MMGIRVLVFCVAMLVLVGVLVNSTVVLIAEPQQVDIKSIVEAQGIGRSYNNTSATKFLRWMGAGD